MRFEEVYERWDGKPADAARGGGSCWECVSGSFGANVGAMRSTGSTVSIHQRIGQVSHRRAAVDEVMALVEEYRSGYLGWTVKHFYAKYREQAGARSLQLC